MSWPPKRSVATNLPHFESRFAPCQCRQLGLKNRALSRSIGLFWKRIEDLPHPSRTVPARIDAFPPPSLTIPERIDVFPHPSLTIPERLDAFSHPSLTI